MVWGNPVGAINMYTHLGVGIKGEEMPTLCINTEAAAGACQYMYMYMELNGEN